MDKVEHALKYAEKLKAKRDNTGSAGFVYLIGCHDFVKVGFTDKVAIRLSSLQTGCPYELKLLASFPSDCMERDERRLKGLWKRFEVRGEWFQVPTGELAFAINAKTLDELFR
jgi:hypothetical protein